MDNLTRILSALAAIVIGSGGVIGLFYLANYAVDILPRKWRSHVLPWVYTLPAILFLLAYLILPTLRTIYLSFLDRQSIKFVGLENYLYSFTNSSMLIAFRNNILWLVLVTGISVSLGLAIAVLVDRVRYEAFAKLDIRYHNGNNCDE
jgi:alpha-glucoside transport system permease protein